MQSLCCGLNCLRGVVREQVSKGEEVEPREVVGIARMQTQAVLKTRLRFLGAPGVKLCHAKHQVPEGKPRAEIDRPHRRAGRLLKFAGGAACYCESVVGIGVLLVKADGGESGRQPLSADSCGLIAPAPKDDAARHASQPNMCFRQLWVERGRGSEEVSRFLV